MINITLSEKFSKNPQNKVFVAKYGNVEIVDVVAKDEKEAEYKLIFMLAYELRGKTIDFNPDTIPEKKAQK